MAAGPVAYGQQWTIEAGARIGTSRPAASVYISDLQAFAFHGGPSQPLKYDVSADGGETWPTVNATAKTATNDIVAVALSAAPSGAVRVLLLQNDSKALLYSDTVFTLPTTSTWTEITLAGTSVGAPTGLGVSGLNVLIFGEQGGGSAGAIWHSADAGATFAGPVVAGGTVTTPFGYQTLASPSAGVWCLINPNGGSIFRSTDNGATWSAAIKTITAGNAAVASTACIYAVNATRLVACYKGQVATSDDAGLTWTDRQNLTLNPPSTTAINQGALAHIASFDSLLGVQVLGAVTNYPHEFTGATTRGAMWRSVDLGTTWTLVDCVGGSNTAGTAIRVTAFGARAGRGIMDQWNSGAGTRHTWFNPNPAAIAAIPATCGAAIAADPCPEPEEA